MQVAVVFVQPGPYDERYAHSAITYCQGRGIFPGYVVHGNWCTVDFLLKQHLVQTVVVARSEYTPRGHDGAEQMEAPTRKLPSDRPRANKLQSRGRRTNGGACLPRRARSQDNERGYEPGMTTGQVRRILAGDEPAPKGVDPRTVDAMRAIATQLGYRLW